MIFPGVWPPGRDSYVAPPLVGSLTLVNPGVTTTTSEPASAIQVARLVQKAPKNGGGNSRSLAVQAAPGVPFTFTVGLYGMFNVVNAPLYGLVVRDSGGKFVEFMTAFVSPQQKFFLDGIPSPTAGAADVIYFNPVFPTGAFEAIFLRIQDNGVSLIFSISEDTIDSHFVLLGKTARLAYLADISTIGIEIDNIGNNPTPGGAAGDVQVVSTVFHWNVTTP